MRLARGVLFWATIYTRWMRSNFLLLDILRSQTYRSEFPHRVITEPYPIRAVYAGWPGFFITGFVTAQGKSDFEKTLGKYSAIHSGELYTVASDEAALAVLKTLGPWTEHLYRIEGY
jgi:hypothetical protein